MASLPLHRIPAAAALGLLLLTGVGASAQLPKHSPFQPLPSSVPVVMADSTLKYGGYIQTDTGIQYRFTDTKKAAFVTLDRRDETLGLTLKQHDTRNHTVTVEYQGRTLTLPEPKARIVSNGAAPVSAAIPAQQVGTLSVAGTSAPVLAVSAPPVAAQSAAVMQEEQRRLDAVAAEVNQRRLAREQASGAGSATPPPVAPPAAGGLRAR